MSREQRILVLGSNGFVGKTLRAFLPEDNTLYLTRQECDLLSESDVKFYFRGYKPSVVINCAGKVGGIKSNAMSPYDYMLQNLRINTNVIDQCIKQKTYLITLSSNCIYGSFEADKYPLHEELVLQREPDPSNAGYAHAKRMSLIQLQAAQKQFGYKNWCVLYPSNLYGENDTFDLTHSHVVASLIMKMHDAKINNQHSLTLFGTGKERRQHLYCPDLCRIIAEIVESPIYGDFNSVNPYSITIEQTAAEIAQRIGWDGNINWDGKLSGHLNKDASIDKLRSTGMVPLFTKFWVGIKNTYEAYLEKLC